MMEIILKIEDLESIKERYIYLLKLKGKIMYIGICNYGISFMYCHKGKEFDSAYLVKVPIDRSPEDYKEELIKEYHPEYNLNTEYVKKPRLDYMPNEDLISLRKVRELLQFCKIDDLYPNNSEQYSQYIEYTFVKRHKLPSTKYEGRCYISLSDFKDIMLEVHDIDVSRFLK